MTHFAQYVGGFFFWGLYNEKLSRSREAAIGSTGLFASAINIFAMPNFDYPYRKLLILNGIYNSVCALANTIRLLSRKFFMARRSRIFRKHLNA